MVPFYGQTKNQTYFNVEDTAVIVDYEILNTVPLKLDTSYLIIEQTTECQIHITVH